MAWFTLTGDYSTYGQSVRNGVQTAVDEVNGVNGFTPSTGCFEDSKGDSTEVATQSRNLLTRRRHCNCRCRAGWRQPQRLQLHRFRGAYDYPFVYRSWISRYWRLHFPRNVITDDVQAQQMADYASELLLLSKNWLFFTPITTMELH